MCYGLVLFGLLKGRHMYSCMTFEVKVKDLGEEEKMLPRMLLINSPMGPEDEMIVTGDLECSYNMDSSMWSV